MKRKLNIPVVIILSLFGACMALYMVVYSYHAMAPFTSNDFYVTLHFAVIAAVTAGVLFIRKPGVLGRVILFSLAGFGLHFCIYWINAGKFIFEPAIFSLVWTYVTFALFGGVFGGRYIRLGGKARITQTGIDATARVLSFRDMSTRFKDGAHMSYLMKLELEIEGHPDSPYIVKDKFWISEFYIHLLSSGERLPVKVDRKKPKRIALDLY